jgi:hypothetical protein
LEFDEGDTYNEGQNNLTMYEFEQKVRKTLFLGENIKIFVEMKTLTPNTCIKDFNKFQLAFKEINKQLALCSLVDRIYEIIILNKSYILQYIGNRKNNFAINFITLILIHE